MVKKIKFYGHSCTRVSVIICKCIENENVKRISIVGNINIVITEIHRVKKIKSGNIMPVSKIKLTQKFNSQGKLE